MANLKISQLNQATAYTINDVVAIVDSGSTETKKIKINDLFRNTDDIVESQTNLNAVSLANASFGSTFQVLRGNNTTSAVIASTESYIEGGQNAFIGGAQGCSIQTGAAGHNAIAGSDGVSITGGYNHFIGGSYSGPEIIGGEENSILSSVGGSRLGGNNNSLVATQGVIVDGSLTAAIACEGSTQQAGNHMFIAGGYNYQGQINNLINQAHLGFKDLNVGDGISGFNVGGSLSTSGATITKAGSTMVSSQGQTTLYGWTLHTDNLYAFERIQSATALGTSINNEQFLTGGGGMVQYTTIGAGNLNLKINGVRNGEVYHWVINNDTGGSVSVNSVATDTGFGITDNSANSLTTGRHIFTIVVVDDHIVIEGTH